MAAWVSQRTGNWALVSGNAASPWHDGGAQTALNTVPGASGTDTVTITATHVVTYDYDMSAAGTLTALVINGTLTASTGTGNWYLKMGGTAGQDITFGAAGHLLAGSSGTALPVTAVFTIDLNGASKISCGSGPSGCVALYCTSPTWVGVRVAGAEAVGQTTLEVDGYKLASTGVVETGKDLTTDTMWAAPRGVRVEDIGSLDTESRVISSTASGAVVVTAGLSAAKVAGAWIWLTWRNVRIIGYTASADGAISAGTGQVLNCEIAVAGASVNTGTAVNVTSGTSMNAGVIHGAHRGFNGCASLTVQGCAVICGGYLSTSRAISVCVSALVQGNAVLSGHAYGVYTSDYAIVQESVFVTSCTYGVYVVYEVVVQGSAVISGCTYGVRNSWLTLRGGVTFNNTTDLYNGSAELSSVKGYGASLSGSTQYSGYRTSAQLGNVHTVIWDIGGVDGAVKAWTYGGVVASVATQPTNWPASPAFVQSYQHTFESVLGAVFLDKPIYGKAGQLITIDVYCKMSAAGMSTRGTFVLIDPDQPLPIPTTTLGSEVMADNTDWQKLTLTYTPTYDRELTLRAYGVNASGTLIWREVVTFGAAASGGGSIFGGAIVR